MVGRFLQIDRVVVGFVAVLLRIWTTPNKAFKQHCIIPEESKGQWSMYIFHFVFLQDLLQTTCHLYELYLSWFVVFFFHFSYIESSGLKILKYFSRDLIGSMRDPSFHVIVKFSELLNSVANKCVLLNIDDKRGKKYQIRRHVINENIFF
jgi:hypothetical protein